MLVLTRKTGESIRIGEHIVLQIVEIKGGKVRLGFTAPKEVKIMRTELEQQGGESEKCES